jgi:hypothetical protein
MTIRLRTLVASGMVAGSILACGGSDGPTGLAGPPVVSSVNGATAPAGPIGSTVLIEGQAFGSSQAAASGLVLFSDGAGGTVAAVIASSADWTDGFIITTVPTGAATGDLVVQTSKGTSTPVTFSVTANAPFSPSTVSWTSTSTLPVGLSGHAASFAEIRGTATTRAVYVTGGADDTNAPQTTVYYATVGATGSLGDWTATAALPTAIAFHRTVVATPANSRVTGLGFLYVLGGATDATGQPTSTVYRGTLAENGTISSWVQVGSLPAPLHSFGVTIFLGNLYIWGGATTGNAPVATVYRSAIDGTGGLGAWQAQAALPANRAYFGSGSFGGYLYAFGGEGGTGAPHDATVSATSLSSVVYAKIDLQSRNLTAAGWTLNAATLIKTVSKHTAVVAAGNVLITGGQYAGASTGSTEESYAQLNADGSTASFGGATGANTILSAGGGNLFNHAAVGYVDGNGAFHVLIVGGDDVNTPGTKRTGAWFY